MDTGVKTQILTVETLNMNIKLKLIWHENVIKNMSAFVIFRCAQIVLPNLTPQEGQILNLTYIWYVRSNVVMVLSFLLFITERLQ